MGYTQDPNQCAIIPPCNMQFVTGAWSDAVASNQWSKNKAAAAETTTVRIPLAGISQAIGGLKGAKLTSIDIWYEIATAAGSSFSATLYRLAAPADNTAPGAPVSQAITFDGGHDTAAKRYAVQKHKMTLTVTTPAYCAADDVYFVEMGIGCAAGTLLSIKEARANFILRM